jgi:hypothetical protein
VSQELDQEIDEVIFGWNKNERILYVPKWSSDHELSLKLVKVLRSKPYFFEFLDFLFLKFNLPEEKDIPKFGHQTVYHFMIATPEQICEAALEAVKLHNKLEAR